MPSKTLIQIQQRSQKLYKQAKAKRIHNHQTSFIAIAKRTKLGKREKNRKGENKTKKDMQNQTVKKLATGTYILIIVLNAKCSS